MFWMLIIGGIVWFAAHQINEDRKLMKLRQAMMNEHLETLHNLYSTQFTRAAQQQRANKFKAYEERKRNASQPTYTRPQVKPLDPQARRKRISQLHPDHLGRDQTPREREEYTRLTSM